MSVRILCDENVPVATVEALDHRGVTATHVTDDPGAGTDDEGVARYAGDAEALLLTNDDDFLDPSRFDDVRVFYYPRTTSTRIDWHVGGHRAGHDTERR